MISQIQFSVMYYETHLRWDTMGLIGIIGLRHNRLCCEKMAPMGKLI